MEAIDLVVNFIRNRFDQPGYKIYCNLENLLLKAAKAEDYTAEIKFVLGFMGVTLTFFFLLNLNFLLVFLMVSIVISLTKAHMCNFSTEVFNIPKVLMVMPATNAVSERSASALRRVKTYLRTTMSQARLNNLMLLHIHKEETDKLCLERCLNQFVVCNEHRLTIFGKYTLQ